jgi:hypothetical protein
MKTLFILLGLIIFAGCTSQKPPFRHDLHLTRLPGKEAHTTLCFHGLGGDYQIAHAVPLNGTRVSFNFPDHNLDIKNFDPQKSSLGTIDDLLPGLYVLRQLVIAEGLSAINLYGFSAGGGAIVNTLAALNGNRWDAELKKIGIADLDKAKILSASQQGHIILDTPFKSVDELIAHRGWSKELHFLATRYRDNQMDPIKSLEQLGNLALNIFVHFQNPDLVLSNRDDNLYIDRLKATNAKGSTHSFIGFDNGHSLPHTSFWSFYNETLTGSKQVVNQ